MAVFGICIVADMAKSKNVDFWENKRQATGQRDIKNRKDLRKLGWDVLVI
ncbi:MAG: hypothetical protein M0Z48_03055 [Nitrospiraceae bacterium]|nr:hypothetical protein [Nitrospiraceae bacterium]